MRIFCGEVRTGVPIVTVYEGQGWYFLPARPDLIGTTCTQFAWGYAGRGPEMLAVSLLYDVLRYDSIAAYMAEGFAGQILGVIDPVEGWTLTDSQIIEWVLGSFNEAIEIKLASKRRYPTIKDGVPVEEDNLDGI